MEYLLQVAMRKGPWYPARMFKVISMSKKAPKDKSDFRFRY